MHARRLASTAVSAALTGLLGALILAARSRPLAPWVTSPDPPAGLPPARVVLVPGHGELFFRDTGANAPADPRGAPTILLLHGWMFPADANWFTSYPAIAEIGRVIALDHRGHGRGTRPSTPFRMADAADDAAALIAQLDAGPVVAVGYSMGGPVAQLLWQRHPELVRGLVLCATSAAFTETVRDRWLWRGMGTLQVILRFLPRYWWERLVLAQAEGRLPFRVSRMITAETPPELRALLPWFIGELDRGSAEDVAEAGREIGRFDSRGWIGSVDVPTAVLVTTRDNLVPVARQRELARRIPRATVYELDMDHDAPVAHADEFVSTLAKAVAQVSHP